MEKKRRATHLRNLSGTARGHVPSISAPGRVRANDARARVLAVDDLARALVLGVVVAQKNVVVLVQKIVVARNLEILLVGDQTPGVGVVVDPRHVAILSKWS